MIWVELQHLRSILIRSMLASSGHDFLVGYIGLFLMTPGGRPFHGARDRRPAHPITPSRLFRTRSVCPSRPAMFVSRLAWPDRAAPVPTGTTAESNRRLGAALFSPGGGRSTHPPVRLLGFPLRRVPHPVWAHPADCWAWPASARPSDVGRLAVDDRAAAAGSRCGPAGLTGRCPSRAPSF